MVKAHIIIILFLKILLKRKNSENSQISKFTSHKYQNVKLLYCFMQNFIKLDLFLYIKTV